MRISDWSSDVCSSDVSAARHINRARRLSLKRYAHTPCCSVRKDTTCPSHQFYVAHRKPCNENVPLALPSITFGHKPFGRRRRGGGRPPWPSANGRAHDWTPVTNGHLVCRPLLE